MHLLSTKQVTSSEQLEDLFHEANFFRHDPWSLGVDPVSLARGMVLAIVKDEGSTRTRVSFEVAMKKLGGEVTILDLDNNSSLYKGESLEDTIITMGEYVDAIVMRHSKKGMVHHCSQFSTVPVINGGDGDGEHPTQALLDAYTIFRETGRLNDLNVMFVGDLKCSRTVHSLMHLLSLYSGNLFYLVSPKDMKLPDEYRPFQEKYFEREELSETLEHCGKKIDVLYMTRLQKERYLSDEEILQKWEGCNLDCWREEPTKSSYYTLTPEDTKHLNKNCKVLHPLPRNSEIPVEFDSDPRAIYFNRQVRNGLFIRMALLNNLFHKKVFFGRTLSRV